MEQSYRQPIYNRVQAIMVHSKRYAFKGQSRLAKDAGVAPSNISRFLAGHSHPSYRLIMGVSNALSKAIGHHISPNEFISYDGVYPTQSVCKLAGCSGCLPDQAYDEEGSLKQEFRSVAPGQWSGIVPTPPLMIGVV